MTTTRTLTVSDVKRIATGAAAEARGRGWAVSIAVGVSGVKAGEDAQVARAGITALFKAPEAA